jgi:hypothetical protein
MSDGGSHFKNKEVAACCVRWGVKQHVVAAYSPWINGLVEGTNKILLYVLARLCAPDVGEDVWSKTKWDNLPKTWPEHLEEATRILNNRILPSVKFSPKELMLGCVVNTPPTPVPASVEALAGTDAEAHMVYVAQQCLDGYAARVEYALSRKATFDRKVMKRGGEVVYGKGDLVQVYSSEWTYTFSCLKKLIYRWSAPLRVTERIFHSYRFETLDGVAIDGEYNTRRLRPFVPKRGGELEREQREFVARLAPILEEDVRADLEAVELERAEAVGEGLG